MNAIPFFSLTSPQAQTLEPDADSTDSESEVEQALFEPSATPDGSPTQGATGTREATAQEAEVRALQIPHDRI